MEKTKSMMKGGWNPKGKDGGRESWRGDFKGINQVVSLSTFQIQLLNAMSAPFHTYFPFLYILTWL